MKKFVLFIIIGFLVSCDENSKSFKSINEIPIPEKLAVFEEAEVVSEDFEDTPFRKTITSNDSKPLVERKLIKNGRVTFQTDSIQSTKKLIANLLKTHKGYVSSENTTKNTYRVNQYVIVKIPVDNFDQFLKDLSKGVNQFDQKEINVSDVTARFYDLTTRLNTKKKVETRYLQILGKAKNVKEILEVEKQLGILREDIESMEGRLKLLNNQISMSTINLSFYQVIDQPSEQPNKFVESFLYGINAINGLSLFVISIWPFVILGLLSFFFIKRRINRKSTT